jgi:hypothetical protein
MMNRARIQLLYSLFFFFTAASSFAEAPLTPEQLACEERQLGRLTYRAVGMDPESNLFLWRSSPGGGWYGGLFAAGLMTDPANQPLRREDQLAFDLILKEELDFLDPARKPLPQATLVRRDKASSLGPPTVGYTQVTFDLALEAPDPTEARSPLTITGFLLPGSGHRDRAARSIIAEDLLTSCHSQVSAFDLKIFEILARTVRASSCLPLGIFGCRFPTRFKGFIFRGAEPLTYRMNLMRYESACFDDGTCSYGQAGVALLFRFQADSTGRLTGGDVQVLPRCDELSDVGCSSTLSLAIAIYIMPPLRPSVEVQGPEVFARSARLNIDYQGSEENVLYTTINWADLLRDTAWNGGTGTAAEAEAP